VELTPSTVQNTGHRIFVVGKYKRYKNGKNNNNSNNTKDLVTNKKIRGLREELGVMKELL